MKITLSGLRNIPLAEEVETDASSEYLVPLIVSRESVELADPQNDMPAERIIKMRVVRVEGINRIGDKKIIKVIQGKTKSQIQRFKIQDYLARSGKPVTEEEYDKVMDIIARNIDSW